MPYRLNRREPALFWLSWEEAPVRRLREGLEILPDYHTAILPPDSLQGRVLWEEAGQLYQANLAGSYSGHTRTDLFFGETSYQSFQVDFSLPRQGENLRFYVTYEARQQYPDKWTNYNANVNYTHQQSLLLYPWQPLCQYHYALGSAASLCPSWQFLVMFTLNAPETP